MNDEKKKQIAEALQGISYREFLDIFHSIDAAYHVTKKELTSEEISSQINTHY